MRANDCLQLRRAITIQFKGKKLLGRANKGLQRTRN
jgi:hypothetical protein